MQFHLRNIHENPRSMYVPVPQTMVEFVLKIGKLHHIMGTTPIIKYCMLTFSVPDYGFWHEKINVIIIQGFQ